MGSLFYQRPKNTKPNAVYLDRDEIRAAFSEDADYTNDDHLRWANQIFRVYKLPFSQGIDVVYYFIAVFDTAYHWNQEHIPNYREIYIRVEKETLIQRNQEGLYAGGRNVAGMDPLFDEPQSPDLVLQNDGERTPLELIEETEGALRPNIVEHPIDNIDYWSPYYQNKLCPTSPFPFTRYVSILVEPGRVLAKLGYGNGRGALYFASLGLDVMAMDLSEVAISMLRQQPVPYVWFVCGDSVSHAFHQPKNYDYTYSRSTIRAINQRQERMLLGSMARVLKPGGKFFIKVRSVHGPFHGKGGALEHNAFFYDDHYCCFLILDELIETLRQTDFRIECVGEQAGFTPYGNDDPPVTRVVVVRN